MTVSYQYEVASSTSGGFTRLLFMWRGSLYKLIYRELLLFLIAFGLLSALYRNAFTLEQKRLFEKVVIYCDTFINLIPLSFVLGFYVAYVAGRWWQQYTAIPWPDKVMHSLALYVGGNDEQGRILRRTLMRYLNLSLVLVLRSISSAVKRRFPTMDHIVEAGFMTPLELEMFLSVPNVEFNTYWIPCTWFICLLKDAKKNKMLINDMQGLKLIMEEFNEFRSKCGLLWSYDWISIPLVYTQVVTLATYSFFLAALVGRQYVEEAKKQLQMEIDIYLPVFTILQFFFFMGLLKVAEQLINPFGDDDEDFELNWLIDRHTKVSYLGVDILMAKAPPLVKDKYFDEVNLTLPYTGAAFAYKKKTYRGSVHNMQVPEDQQSMFLPEIAEEEEQETSRNTPKNSVPNLLMPTPPTPSSAPAGIWRQSVGSSEGERLSTVEEGFSTTLETPSEKMRNFIFKKQPPTPVFKDKILKTSELRQWSSNSTIESFCSTSGGGMLESSFETPNECSIGGNGKSESGNRSPRRPSTGSGQWKGVRWKPILDDSAGDVWSDNSERRGSSSSAALCTCSRSKASATSTANAGASGSTAPRTLSRVSSQTIGNRKARCQAFQAGCSAYNELAPGRTATTISLPNLLVPDSGDESDISSKDD
ncbi:bestrophin-4-like isoform X2 [Rhodnius prolixus]|uniref:bestrophin-4-like isoform X2 n=1 Tax=Rhodnius prolixus TaxID=13249 RepID=UPI003D18DFCE